jgi:NTP pyrophosphatase (non-canonical NTP hydrolase)
MAEVKYYPPMSLVDYQEYIRTRYEDYDTKASLDQIAVRLLEEATELVSPIHDATRNWQKASQSVANCLADILPWLCGICSNISICLNSAMEWKYGSNCPVCGRMPCQCRPPQPPVKQPEAPDELFSYPPTVKPTNARKLDAWQQHLHDMYRDNLEFDISVLPLRLLEDIGSMARAIRTRRSFPSDKDWKKDIAWRAASVLAWTLAICNFFADSKNITFRLHQITFDKYGSDYYPKKTQGEVKQLALVMKCPKCKHEWTTLQR